MATPEMARAFGDVTAVPTLFLFDRDGETAASFYGAPPSLHEEAEATLASLLGVQTGQASLPFNAEAAENAQRPQRTDKRGRAHPERLTCWPEPRESAVD
jgi:hypothetical protein